MDSVIDNSMMKENSANTEHNEDIPNTELHSVWNKNLSTEDHQILESAMKFFIKISTATEADS